MYVIILQIRAMFADDEDSELGFGVADSYGESVDGGNMEVDPEERELVFTGFPDLERGV